MHLLILFYFILFFWNDWFIHPNVVLNSHVYTRCKDKHVSLSVTLRRESFPLVFECDGNAAVFVCLPGWVGCT